MRVDPADVVAAVRSVTGPGPVPLHEPCIGEAEVDSVSRCVAEGAIGYRHVDELQGRVAELCGASYAVAVSSGTAALHLALLVAGVRPGDEVIMPALTFAGAANAVLMASAVPNFVDTRPTDLGINPRKLRVYLARIMKDGANAATGRRIGAVMAVHMLGAPCGLGPIMEIAHEHGLPVIEDAAQALGSRIGPLRCGGLGAVGAVSFNNNKIVTTNGGGAVLTNDAAMQARAWTLATTARVPHPWRMEHSEPAFNYRMGNVNAALGIPQLARLDALLRAKEVVAARYRRAFEAVAGAQAHVPTPSGNAWLNAIALDVEAIPQRDQVLAALHADGIAARALFTPLHELAHFAGCPRDDLGSTAYSFRQVICLPSSPRLAGAGGP